MHRGQEVYPFFDIEFYARYIFCFLFTKFRIPLVSNGLYMLPLLALASQLDGRMFVYNFIHTEVNLFFCLCV